MRDPRGGGEEAKRSGARDGVVDWKQRTEGGCGELELKDIRALSDI